MGFRCSDNSGSAQGRIPECHAGQAVPHDLVRPLKVYIHLPLERPTPTGVGGITHVSREGTMSTTEALIEELKREAEGTRRALERVPEDRLSWRPHPKSMSLGELALHVARVPGGVAELLDPPEAEAPGFSTRPEAASRTELLAALDESIAGATSKLASWGERPAARLPSAPRGPGAGHLRGQRRRGAGVRPGLTPPRGGQSPIREADRGRGPGTRRVGAILRSSPDFANVRYAL